jgi:hypothetical protein
MLNGLAAGLLLVGLASTAQATLFPYELVDSAGVPEGRCVSGEGTTGNVWPDKAGRCHDDASIACVADPPRDSETSGLHESIMCAHVADSTADSFPIGLCDMNSNDASGTCTTETSAAVCGAGGACSAGGCAFIGGSADCSGSCTPFTGADVDCDGTPNESDGCPWYPSTLPEATVALVDADGRAPACRCGDITVDAALDISDILGVNSAIFNPSLVHPLCDTNNDQACDINDLLGVNATIFNPGSSICNRHPQAAP